MSHFTITNVRIANADMSLNFQRLSFYETFAKKEIELGSFGYGTFAHEQRCKYTLQFH